MDPLHMEFTVKEVTVDQLYEELGRLRAIGWGGSLINWHTSRSHIGLGITMSLALNRDEAPNSVSYQGSGIPGAGLAASAKAQ
jgi:hypothetical protein